MRVRFWGVRGSVPWATADSIGYGCNTPCLEIRDERTGAVLVLDAGSGIVGLGQALGTVPRPIPILLTHYHWDHVQGLPFFAPFFSRAGRRRSGRPSPEHVDVAWVDDDFSAAVFPGAVRRAALAPGDVRSCAPGEIGIGGFQRHARSRSPIRVARSRTGFTGDNGDLVYATDHEFGDPRSTMSWRRSARMRRRDSRRALHARGVAFAQGLGTRQLASVADFASAVRRRHLWLFHHKPGRTDDELDRDRGAGAQVFPATTAASEGATFEI